MEINLNKKEERVVSLTSLKDFSEDLVINLNYSGARVIVGGMLVAKDKNQVAFNIDIYHNAPDTFSDILIRSVLFDSSSVDLRGMVKIKKGAKGTNTFLKEDALMMSPDAQAFALPSLEIEENEVKAGHSSFLGPVDQEQIFYLMSRGIATKEAETMVVAGFFQPVLDKLKSKHAKRS